MEQTQEIYNVGVYCRLSRDDGNGESSSISSQKLMLTEYVKERNWRIANYYCDDGYSGTNFQRPAFLKMIDDIENGKINMVICKDLSRLGRNYILCGQYTEIYFPAKGVRFLAINDSYDSLNENNDIAPFKNILNDMTAKDTSRKIKSVKQARAKNGKYMTPNAPYGYSKDPNDKNHLIVNEETAPIIKRIFDLYIQGHGSSQITRILTAEKILTPAAYLNKKNPDFYAWAFDGQAENKRYNWRSDMVKHILNDRVYIGCLVAGKQPKPSYKSKRRTRAKLEDCIIVENTHEPIIDNNTWDIVQNTIDIRRRKMKEDHGKYGIVNEFAGILRCADCGRSLANRNQKCTSKKKGEYLKRYYTCGKYLDNAIRQCTIHYISHNAISQVVLSSIKKYAALSCENMEQLANQLAEAGKHQQSYEITACKKDLKVSEKRKTELERLVMGLYENHMSGRISDDNFDMMMNKYQTEQDEIKEKIRLLTEYLANEKAVTKNTDEFVNLIAKYVDITKLTPEIISQLIEKINVHETKTVDGKRTQQIDIYWRFIGNVNLLP